MTHQPLEDPPYLEELKYAVAREIDFPRRFTGTQEPGILHEEKDHAVRLQRARSLPDYGWRFAFTLATIQGSWRLTPSGGWKWPYVAYCLMIHQYLRGEYAEPVRQAYSFSHRGNWTGELLRALLLANDANIQTIARHLAIPEATVEAFEVLFWRVLDRRGDRTYIGPLVHPSGPVVITRKEQLSQIPPWTLLRQVAWRCGMADALRFCRFHPEPVAEAEAGAGEGAEAPALDAAGAARSLTAAFLAEADFLIRVFGPSLMGDITPVVKEALKSAREQAKQQAEAVDEHGPGHAAAMEADLLEQMKAIHDAQVERAVAEGFKEEDLRPRQ
jgi:hypothetical protein